jgi:hypothetical protein
MLSGDGHTHGCRYSNSLLFQNEMEGLTLKDNAGKSIRGKELLEGNNLNNDLSIGENIAVLLGMLIGLRLLALIGLKLCHRKGWL